MNTQNPLPLLIELAQKKSDEAAKKLALLRTQMQQSQEKLNLLLGYQAEYQQRLHLRTQQGIATNELRNFEAFLKKLSDAIDQQSKELGHWQDHVESAQRYWQDAQRRLKSFDLLEQRRQVQKVTQDNYRQQKQTDEFAARVSQANRAS